MKLGTKSLLFGCHQFILHPLFVLVAWWRLYGRPSWRMVIGIMIHDWGYWGCASMDGYEGERHPYLAVRVCSSIAWQLGGPISEWWLVADECLYHSRFLARAHGVKPSRLCWADKLGTALYPTWLWVLLASLSGEVHEYMADVKYEIWKQRPGSRWDFFRRYKAKVAEWMVDLKAGREPQAPVAQAEVEA